MERDRRYVNLPAYFPSMKGKILQELKNRIIAFLKIQRHPLTPEQMINHPEIASALLQVLQTALLELKDEGKITGVSVTNTTSPEVLV